MGVEQSAETLLCYTDFVACARHLIVASDRCEFAASRSPHVEDVELELQ